MPRHHTQPQHRTTSKKHQHHDLPRSPASSGSNLTGECDRRTSHDRYRSPQHGDAIFLCETNFSFILLTIILYAADRRAWGQKVCFFSKYLCFLFVRCIESTRTDPSYLPIYYSLMPLEASSCFGMISDEGGGGAIVMVVVGGAEVGRKYLGCTIIEYNTC